MKTTAVSGLCSLCVGLLLLGISFALFMSPIAVLVWLARDVLSIAPMNGFAAESFPH